MSSANKWENPPIPKGYEYVSRGWNNGFTIQNRRDLSEFIWIPAMTLEKNGSIDGVTFDQPFGSRNRFRINEGFPRAEGLEDVMLTKQIESVRQHGGFYLAAYSASKADDGSIRFVKNAVPITGVNKRDAEALARNYNAGENLMPHLPYDSEMDSAFVWLIQCGKLSREEILTDSAIRDTRTRSNTIRLTGERQDCRNGLWDLIGNTDEWTQESFDGAFVRGCGAVCTYPYTIRCYYVPYPCYQYAGFRVALTI